MSISSPFSRFFNRLSDRLASRDSAFFVRGSLPRPGGAENPISMAKAQESREPSQRFLHLRGRCLKTWYFLQEIGKDK